MATASLPAQLELYGPGDDPPIARRKIDTSSTFAGNTSLPVHRWFKYSAGFSAKWARDLIEREKANGRRMILDPFAGSGTTIIEGEAAGILSIGLEAHP